MDEIYVSVISYWCGDENIITNIYVGADFEKAKNIIENWNGVKGYIEVWVNGQSQGDIKIK